MEDLDSSIKSSPLSPEPDSAIGTISDSTAEENIPNEENDNETQSKSSDVEIKTFKLTYPLMTTEKASTATSQLESLDFSGNPLEINKDVSKFKPDTQLDSYDSVGCTYPQNSVKTEDENAVEVDLPQDNVHKEENVPKYQHKSFSYNANQDDNSKEKNIGINNLYVYAYSSDSDSDSDKSFKVASPCKDSELHFMSEEYLNPLKAESPCENAKTLKVGIHEDSETLKDGDQEDSEPLKDGGHEDSEPLKNAGHEDSEPLKDGGHEDSEPLKDAIHEASGTLKEKTHLKDSELPFKKEEFLKPLKEESLCKDSEVNLKSDGSINQTSSHSREEDAMQVEVLSSPSTNNKASLIHERCKNENMERCEIKECSTLLNEVKGANVKNGSASVISNMLPLDEHLVAQASPLSQNTSSLLASTLEEMNSVADSENEATDSGLEDEMVVSASMQFTLTPSSDPPVGNASNDGKQDGHRSLSPSPGVPVQVKREEHRSHESINEEHQSHDSASPLSQEDSSGHEDVDNDSEKLSASAAKIDVCSDLPATVTQLSTDEGSKVYLVGTAHFSKESQDDVAKTIRLVHPDVVMVELCSSRTAVLQLDEETTIKELESLNLTKIRVILQKHGKVQGILYLLLLSVSAHITKQLGMAPGGEFRTAFFEAQRCSPGCLIQLGDRPIQITLSRALSSLSLWQKIKLLWHIMASKETISKEDVEKCKQRDFIEELLAEMTGQFPVITEVFVKERDIYLTMSLQNAARSHPDPSLPTGFSPMVVVGVVGIGHVPGIVNNWGKVTAEDIRPIMQVPPPNLSDQVCKFALKITFYGLVGFGLYKCLPSSTKSSVSIAIEKGFGAASKYFVE